MSLWEGVPAVRWGVKHVPAANYQLGKTPSCRSALSHDTELFWIASVFFFPTERPRCHCFLSCRKTSSPQKKANFWYFQPFAKFLFLVFFYLNGTSRTGPAGVMLSSQELLKSSPSDHLLELVPLVHGLCGRCWSEVEMKKWKRRHQETSQANCCPKFIYIYIIHTSIIETNLCQIIIRIKPTHPTLFHPCWFFKGVPCCSLSVVVWLLLRNLFWNKPSTRQWISFSVTDSNHELIGSRA